MGTHAYIYTIRRAEKTRQDKTRQGKWKWEVETQKEREGLPTESDRIQSIVRPFPPNPAQNQHPDQTTQKPKIHPVAPWHRLTSACTGLLYYCILHVAAPSHPRNVKPQSFTSSSSIPHLHPASVRTSRPERSSKRLATVPTCPVCGVTRVRSMHR